MNWLSSLLPSCCSGRSNQGNLIASRSELPQIEIKAEAGDCEYEELKEPEKNETDLLEEKMKEITKISISRRSTESTSIPEETKKLERKNCSGDLDCCRCKRGAEGYCIGCSFNRYCKSCYKNEHKVSSHVFVLYNNYSKITNEDMKLKSKTLK